MEVYELKFLIAKYANEFATKFAKNPEQFGHHVGDKSFYFMNKRPRMRIYFHPAWINKDTEEYLDVFEITTSEKTQSFYGFDSEYGHNVYITCEDSFYERITRIESK